MKTSKFNPERRAKREKEYEIKLRKIRQRIFDYEGTSKEEKAERVLMKIKNEFLRLRGFSDYNNPSFNCYLY
jgi:hypothetical protein